MKNNTTKFCCHSHSVNIAQAHVPPCAQGSLIPFSLPFSLLKLTHSCPLRFALSYTLQQDIKDVTSRKNKVSTIWHPRPRPGPRAQDAPSVSPGRQVKAHASAAAQSPPRCSQARRSAQEDALLRRGQGRQAGDLRVLVSGAGRDGAVTGRWRGWEG